MLEVRLASVGAVVSIVIASGGEATLTLPAVSVAVTVIVWPPSASAGVVKLQLPAPSATVVPRSSAPSYTDTVLPGSAVPVSVGVVSLVRSSEFEVPVSEPALRSGVPGCAGAVVSITSSLVLASEVALPAASVTVAITG